MPKNSVLSVFSVPSVSSAFSVPSVLLLNLTGVKFCLDNSRVLNFQQQCFDSNMYNMCENIFLPKYLHH